MTAATKTAASERGSKHTLATGAAPAPAQPVTFRLPRNGLTDLHFGMARTWWNSKILPNKSNRGRPEIKSIGIKQPGAKRAIRCILYSSAKLWFERLAKAQAEETEAA